MAKDYVVMQDFKLYDSGMTYTRGTIFFPNIRARYYCTSSHGWVFTYGGSIHKELIRDNKIIELNETTRLLYT